MTNHADEGKFSELRQRAETIIAQHSPELNDDSPQAMLQLIHELKVHQIELELQNEELRQVQFERELAQKNYADLYDFAPVGYLTLDEDGLIREANLTGAELLGLDRKDLIGRRLSHFVLPEDQDAYHFYTRRLAKTDTVQRHESRLVKKDGAHFYARLEGQKAESRRYRLVISDISERVYAEQALQQAHDVLERRVEERTQALSKANLALKQEVAERQRAEQALQQAHDRLETQVAERTAELRQERNFITAVLDTAGALIVVLDREGRIVRCNQTCEQISGYTFEEVKGQPFWDLFLIPAEQAPVRAVFEQLRTGQFPNTYENYWVARNGSRHLFAWSNTILLDPKGRVEYVIGIGIDVTQHRAAEEALRHSEARLDAIISSATDAIITLDAGQRIVLFNTAAERMFDYQLDEVIGQPLEQLLPERLREAHARHVDYFGQTGVTARAMGRPDTLYGRRADGTEFPIEVMISQVTVTGQKFYTAIVRDITERKKAQEIRAYLAAIVNSSGDAIIGQSLAGRVVSWNPGAERLYGYRAGEMIGQSITRLIPTELHAEFSELMSRVRQGESIENYEAQHLTRDGQRLVIALTISPIEDTSGTRLGASAIARDITQRKQAELALTHLLETVSQQREQLRALTRRLAEAQEAERKTLARELHDQVGQKLTALNLNLNLIIARLPTSLTATEPLLKVLNQSLKLVEETTEQIQDVMAHLRPPVLDDYGLVAALRWYGTDLARWVNFAIIIEGAEPQPRLAAAVEHALFRIAQEALTNVSKHARAGRVTVTIAADQETVRLVVADDGRGFNHADEPTPGERQHWGLLTMAERAEMVGGQCRIKSQPGQGTQIIVEVPR